MSKNPCHDASRIAHELMQAGHTEAADLIWPLVNQVIELRGQLEQMQVQLELAKL